jgi:CheY-like chemotaxis protein
VPSPPVAVLAPDPDVANAVVTLLRDEGYDVALFRYDVATERQQALTWLAGHAPTCCIVDLPYPYRAGWARLLVLRVVLPDTAFIVLSDDPEPPAAARFGASALPIVGRPFELEVLLDTIASAVTVLSGRAVP